MNDAGTSPTDGSGSPVRSAPIGMARRVGRAAPVGLYRILLVEDEEFTRAMVAGALEHRATPCVAPPPWRMPLPCWMTSSPMS